MKTFPLSLTSSLVALLISGSLLAQDLARYDLGAVPDQTIWGGSTREFLLHWNDRPTSTMTFTVSPEPSGSLTLAEVGGGDWRMAYTPAAEDKQPFVVTVSASDGGESALQSWEMAPQPVLGPEADYFRSGPHTQAPVSHYDVETIDSVDPVPSSLNFESRNLYSVQVIGEVVEIEEDHPQNNLFEDYFDGSRRDLRAMEIIADRVIIRSPLRLKQTDVTVFARELVFEGEGSITTTPQEKTSIPAGTSVLGDDGLPAGDIDLRVANIVAEGNSPRFDLTGGQGEPGSYGDHGGDGQDTIDGWTSVTVEDWPLSKTHNAGTGYRIIYWKYTAAGIKVKEGGTASGKPTSGGDAKPSGKPGDGGPGGSIRTTVSVAGMADQSGGMTPSGTTPKTAPYHIYQGGSAGTPTKWRKVGFYLTVFNGIESETTSSGTTSAGDNAAIVRGDTPGGGSPGSVDLLDAPYAWMHPLAVRKALHHIRDDYLGERIASAQERIAFYVTELSDFQEHPTWVDLDPESQLDLAAMREEMIVLEQQMEAGLDYFGNAAAWVPMLSFEVNQTLFRNELDRAMNTLYLSYWIGNKAASEAERFDALNALRDAVVEQFEQTKTDYDIAVARLPLLTERANQIGAEVGSLQNELEAEEIELLNDTREEDWVTGLRIGLKISATMCQMIPVYQPALGAVGEGLRTASNFNPDRPWDSITDAKNVGTAYTSSPFYEAVDEKKNESDAIDSEEAKGDRSKSQDYAKGLLQAGQGLASGIKDYQEFIKEREAPSAEMLAELERLKSRSPEYKELMERVEALMIENRELADEIIDTMQKIGAMSGLMTNSLLALDALGRDISEGVVLDERASSYLDDLERKALDRLVKYHYYLAKAYEYRLLLPYTEPLDLSALFTRFGEIAQVGDHTVTPEQFESFKSVYQEMLSDVAETIFDHYNANRPDLSVPIRFNLLDEEIETLNAGGTVTLNLREEGFFQPDEENVRIVDLSLFSLEAAPQGGGSLGRTAFVDLRIEHSGESLLKQRGSTYLFRHYNRSTDNPFVWGGRYDVIDDQIDPIHPSEASDSLLRSLLAGDAVNDMLLYSRPSAWADLRITRSYVNSGGPPLEIQSARLEMIYDFTPRAASSRQRDLEVLVRTLVENVGGETTSEESSFQPYFELDAIDSSGRSDARGSFLRTYDSASGVVTITAPARYGLWEFAGWTDAFGNELPGGPYTDPTFHAALPDDTVLVAQYRESSAVAVIPMWLRASLLPGGESLRLEWQGDDGVRLQFNPTLDRGSWEDVDGSQSVRTMEVPLTGDSGFFRLQD
ncbi:hypothetical protein ACFQY0_12645 [Haloferula chungangensis]|uniref:Bacterial repeat domain-containing protein n=1 Tax=Haloferula chungangensis TaxID=1048331 RepID=A0ABW2L8P4_9BACT